MILKVGYEHIKHAAGDLNLFAGRVIKTMISPPMNPSGQQDSCFYLTSRPGKTALQNLNNPGRQPGLFFYLVKGWIGSLPASKSAWSPAGL